MGTVLHRAIQIRNVARTRWIMRGCVLGHLARIAEGDVIVDNRGRIEVGAHTRIFGRIAPVELRTGEHGTLVIGERVAVNFGTSLYASNEVRIGDGVRIGPYCIISDTEVGGLDSPCTTPARPVVIGDGVWLATRVTVRPGVSIGDGTVVAAGSVVEHDLAAAVVAAGAPARVIRRLAADDAASESTVAKEAP